VIDLNHTGTLSLYVDGADECDPHKRLIKGGGAALTREKIIAEASKPVRLHHRPQQAGAEVLGKFPLPVEVIPMARSLVAREILRSDRRPAGLARRRGHRQRQRDPGCAQPVASSIRWRWKREINQIPGVVSVGLFARRPADVVIVGGEPPGDTINLSRLRGRPQKDKTPAR
jgi:ribose 5-phosphate isomerase A